MIHHLNSSIQVHRWLAGKVKKYMSDANITTYRHMAGLIGTSRGHIVHLLNGRLLPFQALGRIAEFFGYEIELYYKYAITDKNGITIYSDDEELLEEDIRDNGTFRSN